MILAALLASVSMISTASPNLSVVVVVVGVSGGEVIWVWWPVQSRRPLSLRGLPQLRLRLHCFFGDGFQSGVLLVSLILWWGGCHFFCPWEICRFLVLQGIWGCPWVCPLVWCLALWPLSLGIYFSSVLRIWEGLGLLPMRFQCWPGCLWFLDGHGHIGLHCFRALCRSCPPAELLLCWLVLCRVIVPMIWHWQCLWLRYIQFCKGGLFFGVLEPLVLRSNLRQVGSGVLGAWGLKVLTGVFFFLLSFGSIFPRFF